jgi:hypothetical protein
VTSLGKPGGTAIASAQACKMSKMTFMLEMDGVNLMLAEASWLKVVGEADGR